MEIKKNRKILMAISVLVLAISITSAQPMAINIGVGDTFGNQNTYALIPINITNVQNESIAGIVFDISFDSSVINLTKSNIQKGDLTSTWDSPRLNPANGRISIVFGVSGTEIPVGGSGSVVILNFSVVGPPGTKSAMNISGIQLSSLEGAIGTASARNGTFTIGGQPAEKSMSGTKFDNGNVGISVTNQPNRIAPVKDLKAREQTSTHTPAATSTYVSTIPKPPESTPISTKTRAETATPEVTTVTAKGTQEAPAFGIVLSVAGLFTCALLARRHNK